MGRELRKIADNRIHCLLFFFDGHHTKDQDFISCQQFQNFTNIIPVMPKADSIIKEEMFLMKQNIVKRAKEHNVQFFDVHAAVSEISNVNERT